MEYCTTPTCKRKLAKIEGERFNKIVMCEMFFRIIKNLEYLLVEFYKCLLVHSIGCSIILSATDVWKTNKNEIIDVKLFTNFCTRNYKATMEFDNYCIHTSDCYERVKKR